MVLMQIIECALFNLLNITMTNLPKSAFRPVIRASLVVSKTDHLDTTTECPGDLPVYTNSVAVRAVELKAIKPK